MRVKCQHVSVGGVRCDGAKEEETKLVTTRKWRYLQRKETTERSDLEKSSDRYGGD